MTDPVFPMTERWVAISGIPLLLAAPCPGQAGCERPFALGGPADTETPA